MSELHFAEPQWIHLLWAVLVFVALLGWLDRRGGEALERFVSAALARRLLAGPSRGQRLTRIVLLGATGAFLTLALMRPQWGLELIESERAGAEIMVALDVSRSMLAEDVAPNRLERAKAEIRDLLGLLDGDQVGLIAFAGRATVLSPLTPDFGFLRLVLDDAGPRSVARGGTRLEEPVRKAIAGFGDAGDVSRAILLITDGEDHDSFPLEAARDAAARGIRILAVGFGDERGSEIPITDPESGARATLRDADGNVVTSRLDGEVLRDMALATDGAYIPAGTGQLDLESIYRRHIAPLTRGQLDGRTRTVRNDAFQWAVLLAILTLLGAVTSTAHGRERRAYSALLAAFALGVAMLAAPPPTLAQQSVAQPDGAPAQAAPDADAVAQGADAGPAIPEDPRVAYNRGLDSLNAGDTDAASSLLQAARERAGTDAELRYRATYNLGWVEVSAADALLEAAPEDALEGLYRSAGWFREAVALRPDEDDARYNLEQVMRRALELADSLAASQDDDLPAGLKRLIEAQRAVLGMLREGVAAQREAADANASPELRRRLRSLAARQLTVLADAESVSERAARELAAVASKPQPERSPEDALRGAQLEALIGHLHQARARIGQTRTRLRRVQAERAYRRAAAALGAFQQARDQLLDPVERLDALLADGSEVARLTAARAALEQRPDTLEPAAPGWLTPDHLAEAQTRLEARTAELHTGLAAALRSPAAGGPAADAPQAPGAEALTEKLRAATPLVESARAAFADAAADLAAARLEVALSAQGAALEALATAREQFLDLRRLIELVHGEELRVAALIAEPASDARPELVAPALPEPTAAARASAGLHRRNVERALRLGESLAEAMTDIERGAADPATGAPPATSGDDERLERGYALLRSALESMHAATRAFERAVPVAPAQPLAEALAEARSAVAAANVELAALRELFFSVLEHLRATAERQRRLGDDTESVATLASPPASAPTDPGGADALAERAGPLAHRQEGLATAAGSIAEALAAQATAQANPQANPQASTQANPQASTQANPQASTQANPQANPQATHQTTPPATPRDPAQGPGAPAAGVDPERMRRAAELVSAAGETMGTAAGALAAAPPALEDARAGQEQALASLAEAIALLEESEPNDERGDAGDSQQDRDESQAGAGEQEAAPEPSGAEGDLAQLLQAVRDREARRREERAGASAAGYEPVEKDW